MDPTTFLQSTSDCVLKRHHHFVRSAMLASLRGMIPKPHASLGMQTLSHLTQLSLCFSSFPPQKKFRLFASSLAIIDMGALKSEK
ncbi:hypothetical protein HanIR_Chr08g0375031 [Helianthus annuus]|nr:hypothetical protein HanIR_Chr08g0375031 [Helianthus annuus]